VGERDETMDPKLIEAREYVVKAREALRRNDKDIARDLGEKAVLLVPDLEDAWLVLVASEANPEDALAYARKALELNPQSQRAHKAVQWATGQLEKTRAANRVMEVEPVRDERSAAPVHRPAPKEPRQPAPAKPANRRTWLYAGSVLGLLLCVALGVAAWSAVNNPAFASFLPSQVQAPAVTQEPLWADVELPKPSVTPNDADAFAAQPTSVAAFTATSAPTEPPTETPTLAPTATPSEIPTDTPTATPEATETPGVMAMEIVADTPTSEYVPPTVPPAVVSGNGGGGVRWIDVNLSTQSLYAYEGDTLVNSFVVSTGTWLTPTVVGKYKIWIKFASTSMSGPGYYLPDVPYVMYFYKGYGIHGTYWHNNFGTPMSHGCVNMRTSDAQWLFNWASVGTVVNVHY
jgi:lipoprotein-anchoring transpeptidase ErfK/SrfK